MAGSSVTFRGRLDDAAVAEALSSTRAFLFPGEEDFGIAPLEAMASGRPVVAYAAGGALDTVLEGETGAFFSPQTVDALADRLATFDAKRFDPQSLRQHALTFDTEAFVERMGAEVERARAEHAGTRRVARVEPAWV
jgi:glycosyltransferase involved in cell wall biosynthesis